LEAMDKLIGSEKYPELINIHVAVAKFINERVN